MASGQRGQRLACHAPVPGAGTLAHPGAKVSAGNPQCAAALRSLPLQHLASASAAKMGNDMHHPPPRRHFLRQAISVAGAALVATGANAANAANTPAAMPAPVGY